MFQTSSINRNYLSSLLQGWRWDQRLGQLTDGALWSVVVVAPLAWGGRGDVARLIYATLVATAAIAWVARQWTQSVEKVRCASVMLLPLLAIIWVGFQLVPLPAWLLGALSPRIAELLPLWNSSESITLLGQESWNTLSVNPVATQISLSVLICHSLLLFVALQRFRTFKHLTMLMRWISVSAIVMALLGLLQYFSADGLFFWVYEHPFRRSDNFVCGSFINRNHFGSFLAMGAGAIVYQLMQTAKLGGSHRGTAAARHPRERENRLALVWTVGLATVLLAILMTASRGAVLASIAGGVTVAIVYWRKHLLGGRHLSYLLLSALLVGAGVSLYCEDRLVDRLSDLTAGSVETLDRSGGRRMIWAANFAAIRDGWLTGSGAGTHADIYPAYMTEAWPKFFSHAENGYLQIATENGLPGVVLLLVVVALAARWSLVVWRKAHTRPAIACFGGLLAGLVVSGVHSMVDFVWYLPATFVMPLLFLVALRQLAAQLAEPDGNDQQTGVGESAWQIGRWEVTAIVAAAVAYMFVVLSGPALASSAWHRYLLASADNTVTQRQAFKELEVSGNPSVLQPTSKKLESTITALRHTIRANPRSANAHLRLASAYIQLFDASVETRENRMPLGHLQDAVLSNDFASTAQVLQWLKRSVGADLQLLEAAKHHAQQSVRLAPLKGRAYVHLANLAFMDHQELEVAMSYLAQADIAAPHDGGVLFEIGQQQLMHRNVAQAIEYWQRCFELPGTHRQLVVASAAGPQSAIGLRAEQFLETFQPDWQSLRAIWNRYVSAANPDDLQALVAYAEPLAASYAPASGQTPTPYIWLWLSHMYRDTGNETRELACLEKAVGENRNLFAVRQGYALALLRADKYAQAEPHLRWCLARRPDRGMRNALHAAAKGKLKQSSDASTTESAQRFQRREIKRL